MRFLDSKSIAVVVLALALAVGCKKDPSPYPAGSNEAINQWIYSEMQTYYYWAQQLPSAPAYNNSPSNFFHQLTIAEDRFSSILQSGNEESYGKTLANTFGLDILTLTQHRETLHLLSQVVPNSQADAAGLIRGDSIIQINEQMLTPDNIEQTVKQALNQNAIRLGLSNGKTIDIPSSYIAQPVVYRSELLADRPYTGYLYLSHFDFSGAYDLLAIAKSFKENNINNLILDLRYNPGGQVSFAAFCALLLAPVKSNDIFIRYRGNTTITAMDESFADALARQPDGYQFSATELMEARPALQRIYILTTGHTASAAEILINNLRPYMEIIQIGETTLGKDMASVTRSTPQEVSAGNPSWHILPLVYKIYNREYAGNYNDGLTPQQLVSEYQTLPLVPFGDSRDPLFAKALELQMGIKANNTKSDSRITRAAKQATMHFESRPYEHKPILID